MLSNLKDFTPIPHHGVLWRVCCFRYLQGFNGYDAGDVQEILQPVGKGSGLQWLGCRAIQRQSKVVAVNPRIRQ